MPQGSDGFDSANALTVDGEGNVVAAGSILNFDSLNGAVGVFTVIKFNGVTGAELWRQAVKGTASSFDSASAIAMDARGNMVAAGRITNNGTGGDFTVIKFNGVTGAELWRQSISGTAAAFFFFDVARPAAFDAAGNVMAAGSITNNGTGSDFTLIKFDAATGAELWRQVINGTANASDEASSVAIDAQSNVVAAGSITNNGTGSDFTVIKFNGVTGAEIWRQVINDTANTFDSARAVAVDARGDVMAAGSTASDFTVVKFNSSLIAVDFDGDGKSDIGEYHSGSWLIRRSSDGGMTSVDWGVAQNMAVSADYDGDGKADIAVYRDGTWFIHRSSDGGMTVVAWGIAHDMPVPADYDGDGKADIAVYRSGDWFILRSSDGGMMSLGWGIAQDIPVPADFDGDSKTDIAVYRDGTWFILRSSDGLMMQLQGEQR